VAGSGKFSNDRTIAEYASEISNAKACPVCTENIYKIYAESFRDESHLTATVEEAQEIVNDALRSPASAPHEREVC
jgi:hypothetical protein